LKLCVSKIHKTSPNPAKRLDRPGFAGVGLFIFSGLQAE